jgi:hypothetical protein
MPAQPARRRGRRGFLWGLGRVRHEKRPVGGEKLKASGSFFEKKEPKKLLSIQASAIQTPVVANRI